MSLPWLPLPRATAMDPRLRLVGLAARGLFLHLVCASDDDGSVWVPEGHGWIDVCATLTGQAHTEVQACAEQLRRVGLVQCDGREIHLPDVGRWQEELRGGREEPAVPASPPGAVEAPGSRRKAPRDPAGSLRAQFANRGLRTREARREWLVTPAGAKVLDRLGLALEAAVALADRAGQVGGRFATGNQVARKAPRGDGSTTQGNGSTDRAERQHENGSTVSPPLTLSPSERDEKDQRKQTHQTDASAQERQHGTAARNGSTDAPGRAAVRASTVEISAGPVSGEALLLALGRRAKGKVLIAGESTVQRDLARRVSDVAAHADPPLTLADLDVLADWYAAGHLAWRYGIVSTRELAQKDGALAEHLAAARAWDASGRHPPRTKTPATRPGAAAVSSSFDDEPPTAPSRPGART